MAAPDPAVDTRVVGADPMTPPLGGEFDPAVADCGCRAPLTPRLARSGRILPRRSRAARPQPRWRAIELQVQAEQAVMAGGEGDPGGAGRAGGTDHDRHALGQRDRDTGQEQG